MTTNAIAYVKLRSLTPLREQNLPLNCSIGGFAVDTGEPEVIAFDWVAQAGYKGLDEDGHLTIDWHLGEFDSEHFHEANQGMTFPGWAKIVNASLDEVFYEAGEDGDEQRVTMELVTFSITESIDEEKIEHAFTKAQVDRYNAMIRRRA